MRPDKTVAIPPLEGLLVVSAEQAVAGPAASCKLADAGARVIKIERSEGDTARGYDTAALGLCSYFAWANRGKESLVLDYKTAEGAALLHRMLKKADVFLQNIAPGALERAGFGSAMLREQYPRLVTCDITGYGSGSTASKLKAYDFLVQCESGLVSVSGAPEAQGRIGVSICDIGAGTNAALAIMMALAQRDRTGRGSGVQVSLFDTAADWMTVPYLFESYAGGASKPVGMMHPSIAPYGAFDCRDGHRLVISIQSDSEWRRFCQDLMRRPELCIDPRFKTNIARCANRHALDSLIQDIFGVLTLNEAKERLALSGSAFGQVRSVAEMSQHPALRTWPMDAPKGRLSMIAPPYRTEWDPHRFAPVPEIGAHTESILKEFGETR